MVDGPNNNGKIELDEYLYLIKSNLIAAGIYSENWDKKINIYLFSLNSLTHQ